MKVARGRLEKAQQLLKYSFELREENPHVFGDRDPLSSEIQNVFDVV